MPVLIPSFVLAAVFGIATVIAFLAFIRHRDYTALTLFPGTLYIAGFYIASEFMTLEAARAWARLGFLALGIQIVVLLVWKYFILGAKK